MEPIIEINELSFSYPDGKLALQDIRLTVMPGEKIALLGANGAGKSTLLLHLNGIFSGTGSVRIGNLPLNKKNLQSIRSFVGLAFQNPDDQLFSSTVFEDVAFGPIHQGLDEATVKEKVDLALHAVHMSDYADRNPYRLSSGEKKRIAIATVLSMQPQILVLDEPSAGLDPRARRELIELLQELPQTMLIATHDFDLARRLTARTLLLSHGQIVKDGSTADVLADARLLDSCGLV